MSKPHALSAHPLAAFLGALALCATTAAPAALAGPLHLSLGFSSLPSAQGFTYTASGSHAGVLESSVFAVGGGVLSQNTIGQANGTAGGGLYYQATGGVTTTETKQLRVRARCTQTVGTSANPNGLGGFAFGFANGATQYDFGITPTRVYVLSGSAQVALAGSYDNTQFHDYVFEYASASLQRLYRDGVLLFSGASGGALAVNRVFFGDTTGGANAAGEVAGFEFVQDLTTDAVPSTWGRIKSTFVSRVR